MQAPPEFGVPYQPKKRGLSPAVIVLIVLGALALGCCIVTPAILFPVLAQAREVSRTVGCNSNLREQGRGLQLYATQNDDRLPAAAEWMDRVRDTGSNRGFRCPSVQRGRGKYGYAFNEKLSKKSASNGGKESTTPLVFDSTLLQRNASSGIETLPSPGRHTRKGKGNNVAELDGHVQFVRDDGSQSN